MQELEHRLMELCVSEAEGNQKNQEKARRKPWQAWPREGTETELLGARDWLESCLLVLVPLMFGETELYAHSLQIQDCTEGIPGSCSQFLLLMETTRQDSPRMAGATRTEYI